jgi:tetratricopeptide (TPR) repeat protein
LADLGNVSAIKSRKQDQLLEVLLESERSLLLSPNEPQAWQARAEFWQELRNLPEAMDAANKAHHLDPNNPELWCLRASLFELMGRLEDALDYYQRAIALAETAETSGAAALIEALRRRSRLLRHLERTEESQVDFLRAMKIPPRDPATRSNLIDLTSYYNASLTETWFAPRFDVASGYRTDLSRLSRGIVTLAGVPFDVRGLIQLGGVSRSGENYPAAVTDIPVRCSCQRLHFLHAAVFAAKTLDGTRIGNYMIHYETDRRAELPIIIGQSLVDCLNQPDENKPLVVAWEGWDKWQETKIRLFKMTWQNPQPTEAIHSLDFILNPPGPAAPFLVAVTAE